MQDDEGHVNWGVLLFSLLCVACGAVWLGLMRTWCALGASCLSCPRKQRQVSMQPPKALNNVTTLHLKPLFAVLTCFTIYLAGLEGRQRHIVEL